MDFNNVDIVVNGVNVKFDIRDELEILDIDVEIDQVSAKMAYWGNVWANAKKEKEHSRALYEQWRSKIGVSLLEKEPKLSEWKVKQSIESLPQYVKFKATLAIAENNVIVANAIYESFKIKANMLQSKGAKLRAELENIGLDVKFSNKNKEQKALNEKQEMMRKINKKRKIIKK